MKYTVYWSPEAKQWFIDASVTPVLFQPIKEAALEIDRQLSLVPLDVGESRFKGIRILHHFPLGVYYEVLEDDRLVVIYSVWEYKKSK